MFTREHASLHARINPGRSSRTCLRAARIRAAGGANDVCARARRLSGRGMLPPLLGLDDDITRHQDLVPRDLDVVAGRAGHVLPRRPYHHRSLQGQITPGYLYRGVAGLRVVQRAPQGLRDEQILPRQRHDARGVSLLGLDGLYLSLRRFLFPISCQGHVGSNSHARHRQGDVPPR